MHTTVIALGILVFLVGLAMVFLGGLIAAFTLGGLISVGAGFDLMILGGLVATVAAIV
ncbi:MAG: hypothetical protein ACREDE_10355 [Thermoplasmata archaeon]